MKMSRGKRGVWLALAVLTAGAATACETGTLDPGPDVDRASLNVHANVTATTVVGLSLEVTAADIDPALIFNIPITDGVAVGTVQVPAGSARLFTLHAFDAGGVETHRGSVTVDVSSGANPPLQITLMPLDGDREIIATLGSIVVTVSPASATTTVGDSVELTGVVLDSVGEPIPEAVVAWATLAPGVAVVDSRGMVTGVAAGDAWIVATYGLVGASSLIQVQAAVGSVEVDPPSATVEIGATVQLTAQVRDTEGDPLDRAVTWSSSNEGVATVDQAGLVTGVSAGPATISATADGVSGQSEITVSDDGSADTPVLTRVNKRFLLDGAPVSFFGLRVVNTLQSDAIANRLIDALDDMLAHGIQSISLNIQGGRHEQGGNSAFSGYDADGNLKQEYADRLATVLDAAAAKNVVVVLQMFYRGQDEVLADADAVREAVGQTVEFVRPWRNLWFHVINEWYHHGYDHDILRTADGQREIYALVKGLDGERVVFVSTATDANDGFTADTGTQASDGDVVVEWVRADEYNEPGVFTSAERLQGASDAEATFDAEGYWFFHAAWHQKADADGWPRFDKGGAGTSEDPGVSFAWDKMQALTQP